MSPRVTPTEDIRREIREAQARRGLLYEQEQQRQIERDRHTRRMDRLPKLRLNTRKKLAVKREEDRRIHAEKFGGRKPGKGKRSKKAPPPVEAKGDWR